MFENKAEVIDHWRRTIRRLKGEIRSTDDINPYEELTNIATSLGTEIVREGRLPEDPHLSYLMVCAMRECLTNLIRHAQGDKLFVSLCEEASQFIASISNNGIPPTGEIIEGGGLSALRTRIEKNGGTMTIQSLPTFNLTVTLPKKGDDQQ